MSDSEISTEQLSARFGELGETDPAMLSVAEAELDPEDPNAITYLGARPERELARLSARVSQTASGENVERASRLLAAMLEQLQVLEEQRGAWWRRLLGRDDPAELKARFESAGITMDRLAGELETTTNPLLNEALTLERLRESIRAENARLAAYLKVGLARVDGLRGSSLCHELLHRLEDIASARMVAQQSIATIELMRDNRRQLLDRIEFLLGRALPLWHQQVAFAIDVLARGEAHQAPADLEPEEAARLAAQTRQAGPEVLTRLHRQLRTAIESEGPAQ